MFCDVYVRDDILPKFTMVTITLESIKENHRTRQLELKQLRKMNSNY